MRYHLSLEEIERDYWGESDFPSHVVTECHRLRKIPIQNLDIEGLRMLLSQRVGVPHILPIVSEILEENPLVEGDFYAGDLLVVVVKLARAGELSRNDAKRLLDLVENHDLCNSTEMAVAEEVKGWIEDT